MGIERQVTIGDEVGAIGVRLEDGAETIKFFFGEDTDNNFAVDLPIEEADELLAELADMLAWWKERQKETPDAAR